MTRLRLTTVCENTPLGNYNQGILNTKTVTCRFLGQMQFVTFLQVVLSNIKKRIVLWNPWVTSRKVIFKAYRESEKM